MVGGAAGGGCSAPGSSLRPRRGSTETATDERPGGGPGGVGQRGGGADVAPRSAGGGVVVVAFAARECAGAVQPWHGGVVPRTGRRSTTAVAPGRGEIARERSVAPSGAAVPRPRGD